MARRAYGTGGVTYDKARGRWVGTIELGWTTRGTRRRRKVYGHTKAEVIRKVREAAREARPAESDVRAGTTIKTWAETWLDTQAQTVRPTTYQATASQIRTWIIPTLGHRRLDRITPGDRRALIRAIRDAGRADATANRADAVLGKMLSDAVVEGHSVPAPVREVKLRVKTESDRANIPLPDALAILAAASTRSDVSRWVAALLQGMRPAECLGLTWEAVDLDGGALDVAWQLKPLPYRVPRDRSSGFRVPAGYVARQVDGALHLVRPKTSSGRRLIPLVPWMHRALVDWRERAPHSPVGLVWPRDDGSPRRDVDDRAAWVGLQDLAQVAALSGTLGRRYDLYEARHTAAVLLRIARVDEETMTALMGHSSLASTRAYLHTDLDRARAALEATAQRLGLD